MIISLYVNNKKNKINLDDYNKPILNFGRNSDQDIIIHDNNTSRNHGCFYKASDGWHIKDTGSTNGIVVNGNVVDDVLLRTGDEIILSIRNQDKAVHFSVIDDEYEGSHSEGRVHDARSTNRYLRMTSEQTDILAQNAFQSPHPVMPQQISFDNQYKNGFRPADQIATINHEVPKKKKTGLIVGISIVACLLVGGIVCAAIFLPKTTGKKQSGSEEITGFQENTSTALSTDSTTEAVSEESDNVPESTEHKDAESTEQKDTETTESRDSEATEQKDTEASEHTDAEFDEQKDTVSAEQSNTGKTLTSEQVYQAVINYCYETNPSLKDIVESGEYTAYWTIGELENDTYTVDYRSYTAAHIYYHVNVHSGEVTTTEFVPGITDGEVPGNETFNAWDYVQ